MSKTCNVCHQTYPDHLQACPHCAKKRQEDSSVIRLHDPNRDVEDSSIEILPEKVPEKKKTHLAPKGRDTKLVGMPPSDEADIGQETTKHSGRAPKTMIAGPSKGEAYTSKSSMEFDLEEEEKRKSAEIRKGNYGGSSVEISLPDASDSSMEIDLDAEQKGSSVEMGKEKKGGSSVEIHLPSESDSSLEIAKEHKPGSSTEIGRELKTGSSVEIKLPSDSDSSLEIAKEQKPGSSTEIGREMKTGSSVEIAMDKKTGSSVEIALPKKKHEDGSDSSLLLGGPGSDVGYDEPAHDRITVEEEDRGGESAVDLAGARTTPVEEIDEGMSSGSGARAATRRTPPVAGARPPKKAGAGRGLLVGAGAGLIAASLLWIFGPLDGLRGSLRETVGLSAEKKTSAGLALNQKASGIVAKQQGLEQPVVDKNDEAAAPKAAGEKNDEAAAPKAASDKKDESAAPKSVPAKEPEKKAATVPAKEKEPAETKAVAEPTPEPAPIVEKKPDLFAQVAPAVKLAKDQKYQEAAAMLQKVRDSGATKDEAFLRCCDELIASWQVREKLGTAGAKQDPISAVDSLLKEKKDASAAMAAAMEKIKSADPKAGNLSQGIDALLQAAKKADDQAKKAEEQAKTAQAGLKKLEKEKEDAQGALAATTNLLKNGKYLDQQSPNLAQGVEKLLADKKNSDAEVTQANARLKEAEETIQDMTQKLIDAKQLKPGEKPVRVVRAPSQDADLTLGEKYYSAGVIQYWKGDYAAAEKDLVTATRYFKDDARFFYYLGLTLWQEGRHAEANEAFQKGNELESKSRPSSPQINAMLERVQGTARQAIDQARERPLNQ